MPTGQSCLASSQVKVIIPSSRGGSASALLPCVLPDRGLVERRLLALRGVMFLCPNEALLWLLEKGLSSRWTVCLLSLEGSPWGSLKSLFILSPLS